MPVQFEQDLLESWRRPLQASHTQICQYVFSENEMGVMCLSQICIYIDRWGGLFAGVLIAYNAKHKPLLLKAVYLFIEFQLH